MAVLCAVGGVSKADAIVIDFSGVGPGTVVPTYSEEGFTITAIPGAVQINGIFSVPQGDNYALPIFGFGRFDASFILRMTTAIFRCCSSTC